MTETILVIMTADDITLARERKRSGSEPLSRTCPITIAITEALETHWLDRKLDVTVGTNTVIVGKQNKTYRTTKIYRLPDEIIEALKRFDQGGLVEPFMIDWELVEVEE